MAYELLALPGEEEYRQLFLQVYCDHAQPVFTFDNIRVKFFPNHFEHAFYESHNWKQADKSIFSTTRAERILWIKETLEDKNAILKVGWDRDTKSYTNSRRVAIVMQDYIVVIFLQSQDRAKFITAYKADNSISKILLAPDYK